MKDSVAPGITHEMTVTITPEMGVTHMGSGPGVLSTPNMIQKMEQTCLEGVEPHLDGERADGRHDGTHLASCAGKRR